MTRRPSFAALASALALTLLLAGCAPRDSVEIAGPAVVVGAAENPLAAGRMQDPRVGRWAQTRGEASTPTRILIPSIGVDSGLESLGVGPDGRLDAPADYDAAGWYSGGVVPGSVGPAIIAGHIDSPTAPAVFARLASLTTGADVIVSMSDGSERRFRVTGSTQSSKSEFPTAEVYSNVPAPELRLITCAGGFDAALGHYTDNLIVFAALTG
ncbi:class F sortase [Micromonospora sp. DT81.3]|uniref:class F sortase n=1 Tax=Micromonospora sp. DT81.3 TaxID=3416523 RepID=UPI003CFAF457